MHAQFSVAVDWLQQFLKVHISQGSAATRFRCGEIFDKCFFRKFSTECATERILKIRWELNKY